MFFMIGCFDHNHDLSNFVTQYLSRLILKVKETYILFMSCNQFLEIASIAVNFSSVVY